MHALIIAQYFYPDIGGASTRAYNLSRALITQGAAVTVVTAFPHYPHGNVPEKYKGRLVFKEQTDGVNIIRTWIPSLPHSSVRNRILLHFAFILSSLFAMRSIMRPDIIIAMNPNLFAFYSAAIYSFVYRRRIIRNVDDLWPEVFYDLGIVRSRVSKKILDILAKISYKYSIALIPVSFGYVTTLVEKYGVSADKITVIEQGVDISKFQKMSGIDSHQDKKIVMYSGALTEGYDFEIVLEAAKILEKEPVRFIIRGSGTLFDNIFRQAAENKLSNLEVNNKLLSSYDLVKLLNSADIFLLPMKTTGVIDEGLPTKIMEYQALGKPIICISAGEPGRYVLRSHSGLVVSPKQPEKLATAILDLANDELLSSELGRNGYRHVMENLTIEKIGKRLIEVIEKALQ